MICACSADCNVEITGRGILAPGHNSRLHSHLVSALMNGEQVRRRQSANEFVEVDPWLVADEFGIRPLIESRLAAATAAAEVRAARRAESDARAAERALHRTQALAIRDTRARRRETARALAQAAHDKLIADAEARTALYLADWSWDTPEALP